MPKTVPCALYNLHSYVVPKETGKELNSVESVESRIEHRGSRIELVVDGRHHHKINRFDKNGKLMHVIIACEGIRLIVVYKSD